MTPEKPAEATQFDLHIILVSLITALTIGKILTFAARESFEGRFRQVWWVHWFWLGGLLIFIAQGWYGYEDWRTHDTVEGVTFLGYLLLFAVPVIQYLLAELLAPAGDSASRGVGMKAYFVAHLWLLYLLIGFLMIATAVEGVIFEPDPAYPCENWIRSGIGLLFLGLAPLARKERKSFKLVLVVGGVIAVLGALARIGIDSWTRDLLGY